MEALLLEFAKYGLTGVLVGCVVGAAMFLIRYVTARADRDSSEAAKNTSETMALLKSQIATRDAELKAQISARDADLSWARAELTTTRNEYLASLREERMKLLTALKEERDAREKGNETMISLIRANDKEMLDRLDGIRAGIDRLSQK